MLSVFVAPDGTYFYCDNFGHLDLAHKIVSETYNILHPTRIRDEYFLFENGYIELDSRSATFRFFIGDKNNKQTQLLTSEQKDFLINNLVNANNNSQLEDMNNILKHNDDLQEHQILNYLEDKYLKL